MALVFFSYHPQVRSARNRMGTAVLLRTRPGNRPGNIPEVVGAAPSNRGRPPSGQPSAVQLRARSRFRGRAASGFERGGFEVRHLRWGFGEERPEGSGRRWGGGTVAVGKVRERGHLDSELPSATVDSSRKSDSF